VQTDQNETDGNRQNTVNSKAHPARDRGVSVMQANWGNWQDKIQFWGGGVM